MSGKKKCSVCGESANVFVNLVKTGHSTQSAYCAKHADELGILHASAYALLDPEDSEHSVSAGDLARCPSCKFSLRDWKRTGRFGCPDCYLTFQAKIKPALERLHVDTVHRGKVPQGAYSEELIKHRIKDLQEKLDRAVAEERFEDAAATRDEMSELRSHQSNN